MAAAAEDAALALWCAGGPDFQVQLMTGLGSSGGSGSSSTDDSLLQAVMGRLEQAVPAELAAAAEEAAASWPRPLAEAL